MTEKLITPEELADHLKVPLSWVYAQNRTAKKTGWPVIKCGKYRRYDLQKVLAYLDNGNE